MDTLKELFDNLLLFFSMTMVAILIVSVVVWFVDDCLKGIKYIARELGNWYMKMKKRRKATHNE